MVYTPCLRDGSPTLNDDLEVRRTISHIIWTLPVLESKLQALFSSRGVNPSET